MDHRLAICFMRLAEVMERRARATAEHARLNNVLAESFAKVAAEIRRPQ